MNRIKKTLYMFVELLLGITIIPMVRVYFLRLFGATIGKNTRIYQIKFINLSSGFNNLHVENDVHIGRDCLIDLEGKVTICQGTTLSPRVTILTHADPGSYHKAPLCELYKPFVKDIKISPYCWIGANSTILAGSIINSNTVVGACSLVTGELDRESLYAGVPAKKIKKLAQSLLSH